MEIVLFVLPNSTQARIKQDNVLLTATSQHIPLTATNVILDASIVLGLHSKSVLNATIMLLRSETQQVYVNAVQVFTLT